MCLLFLSCSPIQCMCSVRKKEMHLKKAGVQLHSQLKIGCWLFPSVLCSLECSLECSWTPYYVIRWESTIHLRWTMRMNKMIKSHYWKSLWHIPSNSTPSKLTQTPHREDDFLINEFNEEWTILKDLDPRLHNNFDLLLPYTRKWPVERSDVSWVTLI